MGGGGGVIFLMSSVQPSKKQMKIEDDLKKIVLHVNMYSQFLTWTPVWRQHSWFGQRSVSTMDLFEGPLKSQDIKTLFALIVGTGA